MSALATDPDGRPTRAILKGIDETLWEYIERSYLEASVRPFRNDHRYTEDKWLTTSALQKCIRRGHTELAEIYARSSVHIDSDHAFRRLAVIALEDIGLGDLRLVAASLAVLSDKRRRQRLGEAGLAAFLATEMSLAVKCRAACDLLSVVDFDKRAYPIAEALALLRMSELQARILEGPFASTRQVASLMMLFGTTRFGSANLPTYQGAGTTGLHQLMSIIGAPLVLHYIVQQGLSRCRDSLAIPYALSARQLDKETIYDLQHSKVSGAEMIGAYPCFAYDTHTRPGRYAIRQLESERADVVRAAGIKNMGNLVFAIEGGVSDRRIDHPELQKLAAGATRLEVFGPGSHAKLGQAASEQLPLLNKFRRQVAVST